MKAIRKTLISFVLILAMLCSVAIAPCVSSAMRPAVPTGPGDLNGSGAPNATDVLMILQFIVGTFYLTDLQQTYADVDASGAIDAADALMVLQFIVGKITEFPLKASTSEVIPQAKTITLATSRIESYNSPDEATAAIWQAHLKDIKNRHSINTAVIPLDEKTAADTIYKEIMANASSADVYEVTPFICRQLIRKKGAAANLFASKTLNRAAFQNAATQSVTFKGKAYGVGLPIDTDDRFMGIIYNKDLVKQYAPDYDLEELYRQNKWDFDTFRAVANACTVDTDGNGKKDIYGITGNTQVINMAIIANTGGWAVKVEETVQATLCDNTALEWCINLFRKDKCWLYKADLDLSLEQFKRGKAAMFVSFLPIPDQWKALPDTASFGLLPMPMGSDQDQYISTSLDNHVYIVPITKTHRLDYNRQHLAYAGFDQTACETYSNIVGYAHPEFSGGVLSGTIVSEAHAYVTSPCKCSPKLLLQNIKTKAQRECDEYYAPIYELK